MCRLPITVLEVGAASGPPRILAVVAVHNHLKRADALNHLERAATRRFGQIKRDRVFSEVKPHLRNAAHELINARLTTDRILGIRGPKVYEWLLQLTDDLKTQMRTSHRHRRADLEAHFHRLAVRLDAVGLSGTNLDSCDLRFGGGRLIYIQGLDAAGVVEVMANCWSRLTREGAQALREHDALPRQS